MEVNRMALVTNKTSIVFDESQISIGCLFYGKHRSWTEGRTGIVTAMSDSKLVVQYHPNIGNITNHFDVSISEVVAGDWEIRWSVDLSAIYEYQNPENGQEEVEGVDIV